MRLHTHLLIHRVNVPKPYLLLIPPWSVSEDVLAQAPVIPRICVPRHNPWSHKQVLAVEGSGGA